MDKKILLLNSNYEVQSFITEKKAIKFLIKEKVDVVSYWDEEFHYGSGSMKLPSILRLKNQFYRNYCNIYFSRLAVFKRDQFICQFCSKKMKPSQTTLDHIIPQAQGGKNSFINCVAACFGCNNSKGNRTPEQAGMKLIKKPRIPEFMVHFGLMEHQQPWHSDWDIFVS